jgi:hypothetical protein
MRPKNINHGKQLAKAIWYHQLHKSQINTENAHQYKN